MTQGGGSPQELWAEIDRLRRVVEDREQEITTILSLYAQNSSRTEAQAKKIARTHEAIIRALAVIEKRKQNPVVDSPLDCLQKVQEVLEQAAAIQL